MTEKPSIAVNMRKNYYIFPSFDENPIKSINLAFELAFHSIPLYSALAYFNALCQTHSRKLHLFQNINLAEDKG